MVLFTLYYYGFHNAFSKYIKLTATPKDSFTSTGPTVALGQRLVTLASSTRGVTLTDASWVEKGDRILVLTLGLTRAQVARFISGLVERTPPHA